MGTRYFAGIDGDWADDPDALAQALAADWPQMSITRIRDGGLVAYDLELGSDLLSLHADGRGIAGKHGEDLVLRLALWWRRRVPAAVRLAVVNDATAAPVYVEVGMTLVTLRERVAAVEAEWGG